ncbi:hypothetical protein ESCO_000047 [Escovopsis weberi]|uniref:Uncharacterized protein n=1 Tax=Escovopsis weberi TaxID=150374 RepID=A0A0M9VU86_ESCWE|nr:hypothetical protein ESCO_000047 [Escovopsis weberi]
MKLVLVAALLAGVVSVSARRVDHGKQEPWTKPDKATPFLRDTANTASGCHYYMSPSCCDNPVCKCPDGKTYEMNGRNYYQHHMHGCDPPGAIMEHWGESPKGACCKMKGAANKWWSD